jgi:hypothetical protein
MSLRRQHPRRASPPGHGVLHPPRAALLPQQGRLPVPAGKRSGCAQGFQISFIDQYFCNFYSAFGIGTYKLTTHVDTQCNQFTCVANPNSTFQEKIVVSTERHYTVFVSCPDKGLTHFPKLPKHTRTVDLSDNKVALQI